MNLFMRWARAHFGFFAVCWIILPVATAAAAVMIHHVVPFEWLTLGGGFALAMVTVVFVALPLLMVQLNPDNGIINETVVGLCATLCVLCLLGLGGFLALSALKVYATGGEVLLSGMFLTSLMWLVPAMVLFGLMWLHMQAPVRHRFARFGFH